MSDIKDISINVKCTDFNRMDSVAEKLKKENKPFLAIIGAGKTPIFRMENVPHLVIDEIDMDKTKTITITKHSACGATEAVSECSRNIVVLGHSLEAVNLLVKETIKAMTALPEIETISLGLLDRALSPEKLALSELDFLSEEKVRPERIIPTDYNVKKNRPKWMR